MSLSAPSTKDEVTFSIERDPQFLKYEGLLDQYLEVRNSEEKRKRLFSEIILQKELMQKQILAGETKK